MEEKFAGLAKSFDESPYAATLGMKLVELGEGYARVSLEVTRAHDNWDGVTHGGLVMSLADQAFGCSVNTLGRRYVALQLNIHFLAACNAPQSLVAEGRVIHAGRRAGVAEMLVRDEQERLIARASGTVIGLEERPA